MGTPQDPDQLDERTSQPKQPRRAVDKRTMLLLAAAAAGVLVVVVASVVGLVSGDSTRIAGSITLTSTSGADPNNLGIPGECRGYNAYGDIAEGATVTIKDAGGKVVATTKLEPGKPASGESGPTPRECTFRFIAEDVPDSEFYGVEVSHRGVVQFSKQQVRNGEVQMQLGR